MAVEVGNPIPEDSEHAVSVSLPTWKANVGYEGGEEWVVSKMKTGYPRFFIHKIIQKLASAILQQYGRPGEDCMLFPSQGIASRCLQFIKNHSTSVQHPAVRILEFVAPPPNHSHISYEVSAVIFPVGELKVAKQFWQHTGEGISSRRAQFFHHELDDGFLLEKGVAVVVDKGPAKGPKRYNKLSQDKVLCRSKLSTTDITGTFQFVEERFGRNLDLSFVDNAKLAIRRRITGTLRANVDTEDAIESYPESSRDVEGFTENDVFLYPSGMSAIYNAHRLLMEILGAHKSICYGFPYTDTLKILEKFGPGCYFYGKGSSEDLDDLENKLKSGERLLALFCEFPSNPLLKSPDLQRINTLSKKYGFAVVIDETIGTFLNVHVLPHADIVVSSLTKIFSGDSNVMGGSLILNPEGPFYSELRAALIVGYEDQLWAEDAIFLERNSRDFVSRVGRINNNAEAVCQLLLKHPKIKQVYYPKYSPTREFYDQFRCPEGGYGGLLSVTFHTPQDAVQFFDQLEIAKGPSLGTNFTLCSPYTILAHYYELDWAAQFEVEANLVRVSIGLEETHELISVFKKALELPEQA